MAVNFLFQEINEFIVFKSRIKSLFKELVEKEGRKLGAITFIFTTNKKILEINQEFLDHHYYTDVITFNSNKRLTVNGDIFISIDQVVINARKFKESTTNEIFRVMIHGLLHLAGYEDKTENEKRVMREKEDAYLCIFKKSELISRCEI